MVMRQWSTTPATNATAATSINFAEGQAPSTLNDSNRQLMADVADWYGNTIACAASTLAALKALTMTGYVTGQLFYLRGNASVGDYQEGLYRLATSSPGTADDFNIINSTTSGFYFQRLGAAAGWQSWTPVLSATSGTFTTTSCSGGYSVGPNKVVTFRADLTISNVGSAATNLFCTLPVNCKAVSMTVFGNNYTTNAFICGQLNNPDNTKMFLSLTGGGTLIGVNHMIVGGSYEAV